ncbi:putative TetR family transcriptional regulator [Gordonia effusa NBRC 100432]|uniref:Putative TetR family transcriptional regulator n=1 Tax=Gordonia effusa NBRC 100432 TaxID=1077974 RepID=H0QWC2_9ACTN|nr:TetR family transcriptional regulator [Gordonia effusa]GAB17123.1 putative TetR family transcriptional regulator [Gordonia effusa NBRC 100432]
MTTRRSGRRPGDPDTRGAILTSARELFARDGFDKTSVRAIASAAGVDAALVHHYFGTKHKLFLEAVAIPVDPVEILAELNSVDVKHLGVQLIRVVLGVWDGELRSAGVALLKTTLAAPDAGIIRSFLSEIILTNIADRLDDNAAVRTSLLATQMLGLIVTRYIVQLEPIASMPLDEVAQKVGPTLQRYLTDDL